MFLYCITSCPILENMVIFTEAEPMNIILWAMLLSENIIRTCIIEASSHSCNPWDQTHEHHQKQTGTSKSQSRQAVQIGHYCILSAICAPPVNSASPCLALSRFQIQCNSMGKYIQLIAQPPVFLNLALLAHARITERIQYICIQYPMGLASCRKQY